MQYQSPQLVRPEVLLLLVPFAHEEIPLLQARLEAMAAAQGISGPFRPVLRIPSPSSLSPGSIVITDSLIRFGDTVQVIRWLHEALTGEIAVVIPGVLDLRDVTHPLQSSDRLIAALAEIQKKLRSIHIRESLWLRRQRGQRLGREPISNEIRQKVIEEYNRCRSIRGTARGGLASRSSVLRILREAGIK